MIKAPGPSPLKSHRSSGIHQKSHWMPKGRWVWEQADGPIPAGHVVAYVDGDPSNCNLDNLSLSFGEGAVSMLSRSKGLAAEGPETRRAASLWHMPVSRPAIGRGKPVDGGH